MSAIGPTSRTRSRTRRRVAASQSVSTIREESSSSVSTPTLRSGCGTTSTELSLLAAVGREDSSVASSYLAQRAGASVAWDLWGGELAGDVQELLDPSASSTNENMSMDSWIGRGIGGRGGRSRRGYSQDV